MIIRELVGSAFYRRAMIHPKSKEWPFRYCAIPFQLCHSAHKCISLRPEVHYTIPMLTDREKRAHTQTHYFDPSVYCVCAGDGGSVTEARHRSEAAAPLCNLLQHTAYSPDRVSAHERLASFGFRFDCTRLRTHAHTRAHTLAQT